MTNLYRGAKLGRAYDATSGAPVGLKRSKTYRQAEAAEEAEEARAAPSRGTRKEDGAVMGLQLELELELELELALALKPDPALKPEEPASRPEPRPASRPESRPEPRPEPRPLPWEFFAPRSSEDIVGQDGARARLRAWLSERRAGGTLLRAALVLHGPPGCGKTALARCCIAEAGMVAMEYGPHEEQDLPSFLRCLGAVDCAGKATCLLLDEALRVLEMKENAPAARAPVSFPVVCTADYVAVHARSRYGAVQLMRPLRPRHLRGLLTALGARLNLDPRTYPALVESAQGDARQLYVCALFTSARGALLSEWDSARILLGCEEAQRVCSSGLSPVSLRTLHENFPSVSGVTVEDAAGFAGDLAVLDGRSGDLELAALSCCAWRRGRGCPLPLAAFSGRTPENEAACLRSLLLGTKYSDERPLRSWTAAALALRHFETKATSGPAASSTGKSSTSTAPLLPRATQCM